MQPRCLVFAVLLLPVLAMPRMLAGQIKPVAEPVRGNELYFGYSYLSNSFNSYANFSGGGLNGWDAAGTFPVTHSVAVKAEAFGFYGNSLGDSQLAHFFLVGGQYGRHFGKESAFVHGMVGLGHINDQALTLGGEGPSSNFSFAADAGAGLDTPIARSLAWRVEGSMLYSDFTAASNQIHGLPTYFARFSTGVAWRF